MGYYKNRAYIIEHRYKYFSKKNKMTKQQLSLIAIVLLMMSCSNGQKKEKSETKAVSQPKLEIKETAQVVAQAIPEFDIIFPETVFNVEKTEELDLDGILITNWTLQGRDENGPFMYFVGHNKIAGKLEQALKSEPKNLKIAFQAMLKSSAVRLGGTDFKFTNIEYDGYEGMESKCKVFEGNGTIKSRVYRINDNLFMVSAGGQRIDIAEVDMFLNSFELKKQK